MDIGGAKSSFACPNCKRNVIITLNDIANKKIIKCSCGAKIDIKDKNNSLRKGIENFNNRNK
jgi:hypothetical protein